MAAAYGMDLRNRVMADVRAGMSAEEAAGKYSVSPRTVYNWKTLQAEKGTVEPRDGKPGVKPKRQEHRDRILAVVEGNSGITLEELQAPAIASVFIDGVAGSEDVGHRAEKK